MNKYPMLAITLMGFLPGTPMTLAADPAMPSGQYNAVPGHVQVVFEIMHMGLSPFYGTLGNVTGALQYDAKAPAKSSVTVDIDIGSIYTPSDKLNDMLKAADAFNVAQFSKATFVSTSIKKTGANTGDITGNLMLHGVTKPVTLHAKFYGAKQTMGNRLGFSATAKIKRGDFGLTAMKWSPYVGDDVDLMIEAEFVQGGP